MRRISLLSLFLVAAACSSVEGWPELRVEPGADPVVVADVEALPAPTTSPPSAAPAPTTTTRPATTTTRPATTTTTRPPRPEGYVPRATVGRPWGSVPGLTMFRGNPTRTFYGTGPVPTAPEVLWRYPDRAMCGSSSSGGETKQWCGTGWTGQPVVWERGDGVTEVIFGAYDKSVHFVDAATGQATRAPFRTGDLIKGSVTLDPDGYPLLYFGSRDNRLRILALDRAEPTELWSLDASAVRGIWNNDWDGNPVIVDDVMYEGGENGWFFAVALNRGRDADGRVTVDPEILVQMPGYDDALLRRVGRNVSIESSVAVFEDRVYFANSGGRIVGLDVSNVAQGEAPIVFDYWAGDDIDATLVLDADGMIYAAVELERFNARSQEVGQLIKLDPYTDGDPLVWGVPVPPIGGGDGGIWSTPAVRDGMLYVNTHPGELLAVDTATGEVTWREQVPWHSWSSPAIVDDALISPQCDGTIRAWSLADPRRPTPMWEVAIGAGQCVESTPAIWDGRIYVGSRDGYFYALGD